MRYHAKKRSGKFSKLVVVGVILLNLIFTAAILHIFLQTGSEPATLIAAFFSFTTVELWALAKIKRDKTKGKEIEIDNENN